MATASSARRSETRRRSLARSSTPRAEASRSNRTSPACWSVSASSGTTVRSGASTSRSFMAARGATPPSHPASHPGAELLDELDRAAGDPHPRLLERLELLGSRTGRAGDDRAGVTHAPTGRRRLARDEAHDRLLHLRAHEL